MFLNFIFFFLMLNLPLKQKKVCYLKDLLLLRVKSKIHILKYFQLFLCCSKYKLKFINFLLEKNVWNFSRFAERRPLQLSVSSNESEEVLQEEILKNIKFF